MNSKIQSNIIDSYVESDYYQNMANQMDYEYAAYGDYDSYNDIVDIGPMYTRDDVKVGTGHPEYNINQGGGDGNNNKGNVGGAQLGSGMTTGQHAAFRE